MRHYKTPSGQSKQPIPSEVTNRPRFAAQQFMWKYMINKAAPFWHNPIANLGVTQGSSGMLFEVSTSGIVDPAQTPMISIYNMTLQGDTDNPNSKVQAA